MSRWDGWQGLAIYLPRKRVEVVPECSEECRRHSVGNFSKSITGGWGAGVRVKLVP